MSNNQTTYQVELSYDGCNNDSDKPLYKGTYEQCVNYLRNMSVKKWNRYVEDGYEFDIINLSTGRLCSYVL